MHRQHLFLIGSRILKPRWVSALFVFSALSASAQAPDDEAGSAAPAPEQSIAPDELDGLLASGGSGREVVAGDVVDDWVVEAVQGPPRLPDGRATEEPCGWVRDVTVRRVGGGNRVPVPTKALLQVPCVRRGSAIVPGPLRVVLKPQSPAAPRPGMVAWPQEPKKTKSSAANEEVTRNAVGARNKDGREATRDGKAIGLSPKGSPSQISTPASTPASTGAAADNASLQDTPFLPEDIASLDQNPRLLTGARAYAGPKDKSGKAQIGVVLLQLSIDRRGAVRRARRVGPSAGPDLDALALKHAEKFVFAPGAKAGVDVDTVLPFEIKFTDGPPPKEGVVLDSESDWFTLDGPQEKGELSNLGSVRLKNPLNSIGVGFGLAYIDRKIYGVVQPNIDLHFGKLSVGFGMPIRFQLYDTGPPIDQLQGNAASIAQSETFTQGLAGAGTLRFADFDHLLDYPFSDWLVPLRYITWGKKEEYLYADFNRTNPITIGHGQLMRRYMPNIDIDQNNVFAEADAYYHFGGVEAMVGPLPIPRLVGGLAFIKPLGLFLDDTFSRSWSVGVSYVADINAPTALLKTWDEKLERMQYALDVPTFGDFLGSDGFEFIHTYKDTPLGWIVQGAGVDSEVKIVKWRFLDIKIYGDYSHLFFPGVPEDNVAPFMGGGATAGALFRLSFGSKPRRSAEDESVEVKQGLRPQERRAVHAFRFRSELKIFSPQYLPSYFNSFYETDKYQFGFATTPEEQRANLPTKLAYLSQQGGDPFRLGWYFEGSYTLTDWFSVTAIYEDAIKLWGELATVPAARNVILHAETAGLGFFQLFATYHYRNFEFRDWLRLLNVGSENELIFIGGRLSVLFLSMNFGLQRGLRLDRLQSDLTSNRVVAGIDRPHSSVGFQNQWNFAFNFELGWSW